MSSEGMESTERGILKLAARATLRISGLVLVSLFRASQFMAAEESLLNRSVKVYVPRTTSLTLSSVDMLSGVYVGSRRLTSMYSLA